jgi:phage tail sheath protein FI
MATVQYKTPGVYVEEIDAFPPSIVGVETAVPAFIGYTEKAEKGGRSVALRAVRISSMVDYVAIFGKAYNYQFTVMPVPVLKGDVESAKAVSDAASVVLDEATKNQKGLKSDASDIEKQAAESRVEAAKTAFKTADDRYKALNDGYSKSDYGKADKAALEKEAAAQILIGDLHSPDKDKSEAAKKARTEAADARAIANAELKKATPNASIGSQGFIVSVTAPFSLYNSLRLFYANGGGDCYVVSVGTYDSEIGLGGTVGGTPGLQDGLDAVRDLVGPTMLVIPEATALPADSYNTLVKNMLKQCHDRQDRVAILDIRPDPTKDFDTLNTDFRNNVGGVDNKLLRYGMAYVPFLKTSIVAPDELDYSNFAEFTSNQPGPLIWALLAEASRLYPDAPAASDWKPMGVAPPAGTTFSKKAQDISTAFFDKMADAEKASDVQGERWKINQGLTTQIPALKDLYATMAAMLGVLPPSPAMAGIYKQNDLLRGVWNAPANVGLTAVIGPTTPISARMQDDLNMPISGLAINAIRDFVGRGTLVWGARTLDGNSNDWRYIQVRRALIYIEQSVELALNKFVFEPNVAQTWVTVTSMIGSFLRGVWQAGGLMGASPAEAFSVQCGLGSTMTADDVLQGKMIVQIKLTMVHPAEFIVLTFQQQMQGGA